MKKYLTFLILFVLLLGVVGCSKDTATTGELVEFDKSQSKQKILTVWMDDTDGVYMKEIIPLFESKNPGVKIEFQHMSTVDAREKLKTFGKSGYGADIFQFPHDHMAQAILDDLVYVLPDSLKTTLDDRMLPVALDIATSCYNSETKSFECEAGVSKKLFAVPISIESVTLYYNKALLSANELPTTFEDLIVKAKAYEEANEGKRYFATSSHWADAYFLQFIYGAFGWNPFGPQLNDGSKVGFADEKSKQAINWMINELKPITTGNGNHDSIKGGTLFEEGKLPIVLTGPWSTQSFRDKGIDYGAITIPTINGNPTKTYAGAQMVSVYKYTKKPAEAIKFVEFLQSDEAAEILYRTTGKCPALQDSILENIKGVKDDEVVQVMLEQLKTSVPMPTIPEVTYYWGPAESMMKSIWNSEGDIDVETTNAERSYLAAKELAS